MSEAYSEGDLPKGLLTSNPWRELAIWSEMGMELSWLSLWMTLVIRTRQPAQEYWQVLLVFALILYSCYGLIRWSAGLTITVQRVILGVFLLGMVFLINWVLQYPREWAGFKGLLSQPLRSFREVTSLLPPEFLNVLFVFFIYWRSIARVGKHVSTQDVLRGFQIGVLMLLLYGVTASARDTSFILGYYLFLFFGLFALSAARIAVSGYLRGGQRIPFDRRWLIGLSMVILLIIALSALILALIRGGGFNVLATVFSWLVYGLSLLLSPLMFLMIQIVLWLGSWLKIGWLFQSIAQFFQQLQISVDALIRAISSWIGGLDLSFLTRFLPPLAWIRSIILLGSLLIILAASLLMVRRHSIAETNGDNLEGAHLYQESQWRKILENGWRNRLGRLADRLEQIMGLRAYRKALAAARVRRIYARLLDLSARLDHPRPAARTPLEFLPTLQELFPPLQVELGLITQAYLQVRYGELIEEKEELEAIELAWMRISNLGREMLKNHNRGA